MIFVDKDLKGKVIQQSMKDGKSVEVDGNSRFAGHRFLLKTRLYGDKKCIYCGRWFHWKDSDYHKWILEKNIDNMNVDTVAEPLHCGSEHCTHYHHLYIKAVEDRRKENEMKLFERLKMMGVIH